MSDDRLYLGDILERIQRVETYTQRGREEFFRSELIQDAVLRNFEVMGEAVKQLSFDIRQHHSDVPWRRMAGFRDVLIHNYMGLDIGIFLTELQRSLSSKHV